MHLNDRLRKFQLHKASALSKKNWMILSLSAEAAAGDSVPRASSREGAGAKCTSVALVGHQVLAGTKEAKCQMVRNRFNRSHEILKFTVKANSEMVRNTEKLPSGPVVYKRGICFATEQIQNTSAMRANAWKFKGSVSQTLLGVVENFMCMP